jgi:hypothetical protein
MEAKVETPTQKDELLSLKTIHAFARRRVQRETDEQAVPPQSARKSG